MLIEGAQNSTQFPHDAQFLGLEQHLFATGSRCIDINSWEDSAVSELTREAQFHVACALKLFEDHFIHLRTGLNQCRGNNGQRSAFAQIARSTKELLRGVQRRGVNTTGENTTRGRCR